MLNTAQEWIILIIKKLNRKDKSLTTESHLVISLYGIKWDAYISSDNEIKTGTISNLAVTPTGYRKQFLDHIKQVD